MSFSVSVNVPGFDPANDTEVSTFVLAVGKIPGSWSVDAASVTFEAAYTSTSSTDYIRYRVVKYASGTQGSSMRLPFDLPPRSYSAHTPASDMQLGSVGSLGPDDCLVVLLDKVGAGGASVMPPSVVTVQLS